MHHESRCQQLLEDLLRAPDQWRLPAVGADPVSGGGRGGGVARVRRGPSGGVDGRRGRHACARETGEEDDRRGGDR